MRRDGGGGVGGGAVLVVDPKLVWQPHARYTAVDLVRHCQLGQFDDGRVDGVERGRVAVEHGQHLLECQFGCLEPHLHLLRTTVLHHLVHQEADLAIQPAKHPIVLDKKRSLDQGRIVSQGQRKARAVSIPNQRWIVCET